MTEQQQSEMRKKILYISIAILGFAAVFLVICGIKGLADTIVLPVGIGFIIFLYWVVSDVLSVFWIKEFDGKTEKQKHAYYIFAAMDLLALGGLVYFLMDMNSMTGVLVYVLFNMTKKRYRDEFLGVLPKADEEKQESERKETEEENMEAKHSTDENADSCFCRR